jgi:hypothetical protein
MNKNLLKRTGLALLIIVSFGIIQNFLGVRDTQTLSAETPQPPPPPPPPPPAMFEFYRIIDNKLSSLGLNYENEIEALKTALKNLSFTNDEIKSLNAQQNSTSIKKNIAKMVATAEKAQTVPTGAANKKSILRLEILKNLFQKHAGAISNKDLLSLLKKEKPLAEEEKSLAENFEEFKTYIFGQTEPSKTYADWFSQISEKFPSTEDAFIKMLIKLSWHKFTPADYTSFTSQIKGPSKPSSFEDLFAQIAKEKGIIEALKTKKFSAELSQLKASLNYVAGFPPKTFTIGTVIDHLNTLYEHRNNIPSYIKEKLPGVANAALAQKPLSKTDLSNESLIKKIRAVFKWLEVPLPKEIPSTPAPKPIIKPTEKEAKPPLFEEIRKLGTDDDFKLFEKILSPTQLDDKGRSIGINFPKQFQSVFSPIFLPGKPKTTFKFEALSEEDQETAKIIILKLLRYYIFFKLWKHFDDEDTPFTVENINKTDIESFNIEKSEENLRFIEQLTTKAKADLSGYQDNLGTIIDALFRNKESDVFGYLKETLKINNIEYDDLEIKISPSNEEKRVLKKISAHDFASFDKDKPPKLPPRPPKGELPKNLGKLKTSLSGLKKSLNTLAGKLGDLRKKL